MNKIFDKLISEIEKVFIGNRSIIEHAVIAVIAGLHVLFEDAPGTGKTTLVKTIAKAAALDYGRIQFTPDLLPGDILGMTVWDKEGGAFVYKQGSAMHQLLLADEINRASPRTQAGLLEAMQEKQITVDGTLHKLPEPFIVMATQNPIGYAGTFELPEPQLDRFGMRLSIGYPPSKSEKDILLRFMDDNPLNSISPVIQNEELAEAAAICRKIKPKESLLDYMTSVSAKTRQHSLIRIGLSPRALQHWQAAAQVKAYINERNFCLPEDLKELAIPVLAHRLQLSQEARMKQIKKSTVLNEILETIPLPTGI